MDLSSLHSRQQVLRFYCSVCDFIPKNRPPTTAAPILSLNPLSRSTPNNAPRPLADLPSPKKVNFRPSSVVTAPVPPLPAVAIKLVEKYNHIASYVGEGNIGSTAESKSRLFHCAGRGEPAAYDRGVEVRAHLPSPPPPLPLLTPSPPLFAQSLLPIEDWNRYCLDAIGGGYASTDRSGGVEGSLFSDNDFGKCPELDMFAEYLDLSLKPAPHAISGDKVFSNVMLDVFLKIKEKHSSLGAALSKAYRNGDTIPKGLFSLMINTVPFVTSLSTTAVSMIRNSSSTFGTLYTYDNPVAKLKQQHADKGVYIAFFGYAADLRGEDLLVRTGQKNQDLVPLLHLVTQGGIAPTNLKFGFALMFTPAQNGQGSLTATANLVAAQAGDQADLLLPAAIVQARGSARECAHTHSLRHLPPKN